MFKLKDIIAAFLFFFIIFLFGAYVLPGVIDKELQFQESVYSQGKNNV